MTRTAMAPAQTRRRLTNITTPDWAVEPVRIGPFIKAAGASLWNDLPRNHLHRNRLHQNRLHPSRPTDPLPGALVSDFDELVSNCQPDRIVPRDVHRSFDYHHGPSRIICNAHGYGRDNLRFHDALLVESGP